MALDSGAEGGEEDHAVVFAVVIASLGVLFGTFLRWLETQLLPDLREHRLLRYAGMPPYTLSVFLVGVLTSGLHDALNPEGALPSLISLAIRAAQGVDAHVLLLALLPPLIYESAANMSWHVFSKVSGQAFILAFPGVIIQAYLVAAFFRYAMAYGGEAEGGLWDWDVALVLGSIVSATDPVAVVAALHTLGAPEKLADVIDGEALLNDGSAMVMFLIFLENVRSKALGLAPHSFGSGLAFFLQLSLGGCALGAATFALLSTGLLLVENDWRVEIGALLVAVYATFAAAENFFHVSGVLAVVTLGLLMSRRGKYAFSPRAAAVAEGATPLIAHVSETLIFYIAGIAAWTALYAHRDAVRYSDALVLYALLQAVRAAAFCLLYPLLSRMGYRMNWREGAVTVHAGLRGAVSLALALLAIDEPLLASLDKARIHFLVASTAVLTMLLNGTSTPYLYERLRLYPANAYRSVMVARVVEQLDGPAMQGIRQQLSGSDKLYSRADWDVVFRLVPALRGIRVLASNRLLLPDSVRTRVYDRANVQRIAAAEPAEAAALRIAGSPPQPGTPLRTAADGAGERRRLARARSRSDAAGALGRAPVELGGAAGLWPAAPPKQRRASTGALPDPGALLAGGAEGGGRPQQDPRKEWRERAAQLQQQEWLRRRREASGASAGSRHVSGLLDSLGSALRGGGGGGGGEPATPSAGGSRALARTRHGRAGGVRFAPGAAEPASPEPALSTGPQADAAVLGRLEQLAHRDRHLQPPSARGGSSAADASFRASFTLPGQCHYSRADKRDGIVETLFLVVRKLYAAQYETKQLAGGPLAALVEALSSGEEYLAQFPHATAAAAFDLELDVLLWQLPPTSAWRRALGKLPLLGGLLGAPLDFHRAFDRTEALAGFIRAHEELGSILSDDASRMAVVREAVAPALARAEAELTKHHLERWGLVSLQINMLTARAAVRMKRAAMEEVAETGALTEADVAQLGPVFDRAVHLLDAVRFSLLAPYRYRRLLRAAQGGSGAGEGGGAEAPSGEPQPAGLSAVHEGSR